MKKEKCVIIKIVFSSVQLIVIQWCISSYPNHRFKTTIANVKINTNQTNKRSREIPWIVFVFINFLCIFIFPQNSQSSLYHNHRPETLSWPRRFDALKREIDEISPDILCLQEVQNTHLTEIANHFNTLGYDTSLFKKRTGLQVDGCAIFFKKSLFNLVEFHFVDYFQPDIKVWTLSMFRLISFWASSFIVFCFILFRTDSEPMQCGNYCEICPEIESQCEFCCFNYSPAVQSEATWYTAGNTFTHTYFF